MFNQKALLSKVSNLIAFGPTSFSLYLTAMLQVAVRNTEEGVNIQTLHQADFFNVPHLKARSKTETLYKMPVLTA